MDAAGPVLGGPASPRPPRATLAFAGVWMAGFILGCAHSEPASPPARRPIPDTTGKPNVVPLVSTEPTAWEREQVRQAAARAKREREEYEQRAILQMRRAEREARQAERERRKTEKQLAREYARARSTAEKTAEREAARQAASQRSARIRAAQQGEREAEQAMREAESLRKQAAAARAQREAQERRLKIAADRKAEATAALLAAEDEKNRSAALQAEQASVEHSARQQARLAAERARQEQLVQRSNRAAEIRDVRRARSADGQVRRPKPLIVPTGSGTEPEWAQPMSY